jgi:hypothetical protein
LAPAPTLDDVILVICYPDERSGSAVKLRLLAATRQEA